MVTILYFLSIHHTKMYLLDLNVIILKIDLLIRSKAFCMDKCLRMFHSNLMAL